MILDIIGVGLIGSTTSFSKTIQHFAETTDRISDKEPALIWGTSNKRTRPGMAAFINGSINFLQKYRTVLGGRRSIYFVGFFITWKYYKILISLMMHTDTQ